MGQSILALRKEHFINEKSLKKAQDIKDQIKGYLNQIENEKIKEGNLSQEMKNKIDLLGLESLLNNEKESKKDLIFSWSKARTNIKMLIYRILHEYSEIFF